MANFTPQQIEQFLQEFFDVVGARQYVGARYVPIFGRAGEDTVEWDDTAPYEPLTVVMHQGVSYVSRRYVPNGIQITDTAYWVQTYRFNAQVEQYRQEVLSYKEQVYDRLPYPYVPNSRYGEEGQVLTTLADGNTKWSDPVVVDSEIAGPLIDEWLTEHPEATTTVEDGVVSIAKLDDDSRGMMLESMLEHPHNIDFMGAYNKTFAAQNGITVSKNNDGSYTLNGTATAHTNFEFVRDAQQNTAFTPGRTYYGVVDCDSALPSGVMVNLYAYQEDELDSHRQYWSMMQSNRPYVIAINAEQTGPYIIWLRVLSGTTLNNLTIHPHIYAWNPGDLEFYNDARGYVRTDGTGSYYDLNEFDHEGYYLIETSYRKINAPNDTLNIVQVTKYGDHTGNYLTQEVGFITGATDTNLNRRYIRYKNNSGWTNWIKIEPRTTVNNTNTFNYTVNQDSYNVTVTPTIQAVTDNYLAPSGDRTDRSADIAALLQSTGVCKLGAGDYYITAGVSMPDNTSIIGCGKGTRLILDDSVTDGYVISLGSYCSVQDCWITGKDQGSDLPYSEYQIGGRSGIVELGDATGFDTPSTFTHNFDKLSNLWIDNFNGCGIKAYRNDGAASILANNIDILRCGIGINIEMFSEFHAWNNIRCRWCVYACIMNGGNNLFNNCHWDVCIHLLKIDNSLGNLVNDTHSSFANCTFCHANSNTGNAIECLNVHNGLVFTNCQIFYSKIILRNCSGVVMTNFNFGFSEQIVLDTCEGINISNCIFGSAPTVTSTFTTGLVFANNMTRSGVPVTV